MVRALVVESARELAEQIVDPELPAVTIGELGMIRDVTIVGDDVLVTLTPTYAACPAISIIEEMIGRALRAGGYRSVRVQRQLSPPWSSDWISAIGRDKLAAAGVAPPAMRPRSTGPIPLTLTTRRDVPCPRCGSTDTVELAPFGATACTSLQRCRACREPFEYVKEV